MTAHEREVILLDLLGRQVSVQIDPGRVVARQ
jgi:hypothetical protein